MSTRRFGPVQAAGVVLVERDAGKSVEGAARGHVAYTGLTERGPVGKVEFCGDVKTFVKKYGGRISDGSLPDAALDFFEHSAGAGGVWVQRLTDGTEERAALTLWSRHAAPVPVVLAEGKDGGGWAGRRLCYRGVYAAPGDLTETQLTTGLSRWKANQLKGAALRLSAAPGKSYRVLANTAAGVITVAGDSKMLSNSGVQADKGFFVEVLNRDSWGVEKYLALKVVNGANEPAGEWGVEVYVHGEMVKVYPNLSSDPQSVNYFVNVVNKDPDNWYVKLTDLFSGDATAADVRPSNLSGVIPTTGITASTLTLPDPQQLRSAAGDGTAGAFLYGSDARRQTVTLTFTSPTAFDVESSIEGVLPAGTVGTPYPAPNDQMIGFTVTAGATPFVAMDKIELNILLLERDEAVGGYLYPNVDASPRIKFRIVSNTARVITVASGSDMTVVGAPGDRFRLEHAAELGGGYNGASGISDMDFETAYSLSTSPWRNLAGKGAGLVKLATPGVSSTAVQKAGAALAEALNYQYRYEIPASMVDEGQVEAYVSETLGRNDFAVVSFPSYAQVRDPRPGATAPITRTIIGMIHGREALVAKNYEGYHKAAAGSSVTLPFLIDLPAGLDGGKVINEEILNPRGINVIRKVKGNFVLWGDRTCFVNSGWKWKHQREQMTAYEHDLQENFDWIIFEMNALETRADALATLSDYFEGEFRKGALSGATFEDACSIQIDEGNNSLSDGAAGELNADISIRLVDTVERFVISIGKAGIFESSAS